MMAIKLYCEKHETEHGAGGCFRCLIDGMGAAGAAMSATAPILQPIMITGEQRRKMAEKSERDRGFFEMTKEFHETEQKKRMMGARLGC